MAYSFCISSTPFSLHSLHFGCQSKNLFRIAGKQSRSPKTLLWSVESIWALSPGVVLALVIPSTGVRHTTWTGAGRVAGTDLGLDSRCWSDSSQLPVYFLCGYSFPSPPSYSQTILCDLVWCLLLFTIGCQINPTELLIHTLWLAKLCTYLGWGDLDSDQALSSTPCVIWIRMLISLWPWCPQDRCED